MTFTRAEAPEGSTVSQQEGDLFNQKVSLSGRPTAPAWPGCSRPEREGSCSDGWLLPAHALRELLNHGHTAGKVTEFSQQKQNAGAQQNPG